MSTFDILRILSEDKPNIDALSQALDSITRLDLSYANVGDEGMITLGRALTTNTSLRTLDLYRNDVGARGATALGRALTLEGEGNTTLQTLNLTRNRVGDEGASALARALTTNTTLEELTLHRNNVGDEGAVALAQALTTNTALEKLSLSFNNVGDEGAVALGQALTTNTALEKLSLSFNKISDQGAVALGQTLLTNTTLQELYVGQRRMLIDWSFLDRNRAMYRAKPLRVANLLGVQERPKVFKQIREHLEDGDEHYVEDDGEAELFTRRPLYTVDIGVIILMYLDEMEHIMYNIG